MATRFAGATTAPVVRLLGSLTGLADAPGVLGPYTLSLWFTVDSLHAAYERVISSLHSATSTFNADVVRISVSGGGGVVVLAIGDGSSVFLSTSTVAPIFGRYYHVGLVRLSASLIRMYLNGVLLIEDTRNMTGRSITSTNLYLGAQPDNTRQLDGLVAGVKLWSAALNQGEIAVEMASMVPVRRANLAGWWPMHALAGVHTDDASPYHRDLTEPGTVGPLVDDPYNPPIPWAPSIRRSTPVRILLAGSITAPMIGITASARVASFVSGARLSPPIALVNASAKIASIRSSFQFLAGIALVSQAKAWPGVLQGGGLNQLFAMAVQVSALSRSLQMLSSGSLVAGAAQVTASAGFLAMLGSGVLRAGLLTVQARARTVTFSQSATFDVDEVATLAISSPDGAVFAFVLSIYDVHQGTPPQGLELAASHE